MLYNFKFHGGASKITNKEVRIMKKTLVMLLTVALVIGFSSIARATVAGSPHDLSTGSGGVETNTSEICVFCHYPHNANPSVPLWNHNLPASTSYNLYWSETMNSTYPDGITPANLSGTASLLCLSCHDGTVGVSAVSYPGGFTVTSDPSDIINEAGGNVIRPTASVYVGIDLSNDHPVNIIYPGSAGDPDIKDTTNVVCGSVTTAKLLRGGEVHCVSCHEPHKKGGTDNDVCGNVLGASEHFMRIRLNGSALCYACHSK